MSDSLSPLILDSMPLARAKLINALNDALGTSQEVCFDPMAQSSSHAVSTVYLNVNGVVLEISSLSDDFLESDELLKTVNIGSLPPQLSAAALELAFADEIDKIAAATNAYVTFCEQPSGFEPTDSFFCALKREQYSIPLKVSVSGTENEEKLAAMLRNVRKQTLPQFFKYIPYDFGFDIGYVSLKADQLRNISCGDVLIPDVFLLESNLSYVKTPKGYLVFELNNGNAVFKGIKSSILEEHADKMSEELNKDGIKVDNSGPELREDAISPGELNFEVAFEIDRKLLSYDDLTSMKVGSVMPLSCSKKSPVVIKVNGRAVGNGRLVDLGETVGVQIIDLKN